MWELGLTDSKATFVPDFPAFNCSFSPRLVTKSQGGNHSLWLKEDWPQFCKTVGHVLQAWPIRGAHIFGWRGVHAIKVRLVRVQPRPFLPKLLGKMTSFLVVIKLLSACAQGYQWLYCPPGGESLPDRWRDRVWWHLLSSWIQLSLKIDLPLHILVSIAYRFPNLSWVSVTWNWKNSSMIL